MRFEVLTEVKVNSTGFWDVLPYSLADSEEHITLSDSKNNPSKEAASLLCSLVSCSAYLDPADGSNIFLRNVCNLLPDYMEQRPRS
jgi:hypothetical protein